MGVNKDIEKDILLENVNKAQDRCRHDQKREMETTEIKRETKKAKQKKLRKIKTLNLLSFE